MVSRSVDQWSNVALIVASGVEGVVKVSEPVVNQSANEWRVEWIAYGEE